MPEDGPSLINEIVVTQSMQLRKNSFTVDGQPFPWHLVGEITTSVSSDAVPSITITLPANKVTIIHAIDLIQEEEVD